MDISAFEEDIARLDRILRPIAKRPVDITAPDWIEKLRALRPLEEAGIESKTQSVLENLLVCYSQSQEPERAAIRRLFERYTAFRWAAHLPSHADAAEGFRMHLLHLSARDQGADARDEILTLQHLCATATEAGIDIAPILREVAALSSKVDKYGMGSTNDFLLTAANRSFK